MYTYLLFFMDRHSIVKWNSIIYFFKDFKGPVWSLDIYNICTIVVCWWKWIYCMFSDHLSGQSWLNWVDKELMIDDNYDGLKEKPEDNRCINRLYGTEAWNCGSVGKLNTIDLIPNRMPLLGTADSGNQHVPSIHAISRGSSYRRTNSFNFGLEYTIFSGQATEHRPTRS